MNLEEKTAFVEEIQGKLAGARSFYLTDFTGLSVKEINEFRARLRQQGVAYVVVKNTLARRALEGLELPDVASFFAGPTGLVIGREDAVSAAKVMTEFAKEFDGRPVVKAGVVESREVGAEEVKRLATLPPKEVLLAQFAGGLRAPATRLAGGMNELVARLARVVEALRRKREAAGG
ncbi:MAG: 50S ribosomal protein L10 [Longimicrobiaceae bacterium]